QITVVRGPAGPSRSAVFGVPANLAALFPGGLGGLSSQLAYLGPRSGVLLSERVAQVTGASAGDRVTLRTVSGPVRSELLGAVANSPFAAVDGGNFALVSLARAEDFFGSRDRPSVIYVTARDGISVNGLRRSLRRRLGARSVVRSPEESAAVFRVIFDSIASLSEQARAVALLVALFLVFNTMSMSLAERRWEVAMLSLTGARRRQVMVAFLAEAFVLGLVGGAVGILGGVALGSVLVQRVADSYAVLPLSSSGPLQTSLATILLGLGAGVAVVLAGAAWPAWRILNVRPIEALLPQARYEWGRRASPR